MVTAYIALGANLGDRAGNITDAIELLRATPGVEVTKLSSLHECPAVGGPPDSPPFLNAAAELRTTLSPQQLLDRLLEIERSLGRQRREKWGPRLIDLDLLLYADWIVAEPNLQIPHPLMHERRFVLEPLAEVAASIVHPVIGLSVQALLQALNTATPRPIIPVGSSRMTITIDTSAVIAVISGEPTRLRILEATRDHELIAPPTLPWEIANAFSSLFKRKRADLDGARAALEVFHKIPVRYAEVQLITVMSLSAALQIYAYDACMIACALEHRSSLLTLDGGLRDASRRAGVAVLEMSS